MKTKSIIIIAVFILAIAGAYFGISSLSLIGEGESVMYPDVECSTVDDCYNYFADGMTRNELDASLAEENVEFICVSNICGVQTK